MTLNMSTLNVMNGHWQAVDFIDLLLNEWNSFTIAQLSVGNSFHMEVTINGQSFDNISQDTRGMIPLLIISK